METGDGRILLTPMYNGLIVTISTMTGVIELKKPVSKNISEQTNPNETKAMLIGTARHLIKNSEMLIILMI